MTDPATLPIPLLIGPFALLFIAIYVTLGVLMEKYAHQSHPRVKRIAFAGSSVIVLALALQSLGQLTVRDVLVSIAVITIGYFYIGRTVRR